MFSHYFYSHFILSIALSISIKGKHGWTSCTSQQGPASKSPEPLYRYQALSATQYPRNPLCDRMPWSSLKILCATPSSPSFRPEAIGVCNIENSLRIIEAMG